jgi:hypothetical protein
MSEYAEFHSINENAYVNATLAGMGSVASPQPSIYPPAMGYPPANTYKPPARNKHVDTSRTHTHQQSTSHGYNYMNVSKFYPYPTNM